MDFLDKNIEEYAQSFTSPESDLMNALNRETYSNKLQPRMLSGHIQGSFLAMVSKMINPRRILEIGTYTGYSALSLATGLTDDGLLYTLEVNEEHEEIAKRYFKQAGLENKIIHKLGKAEELIVELNEPWDLVFIDADKINYGRYYDLIINSLPKGAWILADNVLWSGKVLLDDDQLDPDTLALKDFSRKIQEDERVENMILPFRDGLMLIRKR